MRLLGIALILLGAGVPALIVWAHWQYTVGFSRSDPYPLAAVVALDVGAIVAGVWLVRRGGRARKPRLR